jgi:beta-galactosidase
LINRLQVAVNRRRRRRVADDGQWFHQLMNILKMNFRKVVLGFLVVHTGVALFGASLRDQSFDSDWSFLRGDAPGAENPAFDDSQWRKLDVPHDWSIEDLPSKTNAVPELEAVAGQWRFHPGDDANWKTRELDDSQWQQVMLPDNWEHHSNYTNDNVYGWFRRRIEIPEDCRGRDFDLLLGRVDDVDETFLNGERIGGTGTFPPGFRTAFSSDRRYHVPASLVRGDGTDLLAVRVFDGTGNGGILAAGVKSVRIGPFDSKESENGHFTGYTVGGIGWYRKHFTLNETNQLVAVRFDGVYMNSEIWINGHRLGEHPHGYTSFEFDLTPYLNPSGQENVLAVRVRNEGRNSRWYSGSGIYRHVWLTIREPIHVPTSGVFVTTPEASRERALVRISIEVTNAADVAGSVLVRARVRDAKEREVGRSEQTIHLAMNELQSPSCFIEVRSPSLWSLDSPNLYFADIELVAAEKIVDAVSMPFGIRSVEVNAEHGLRINGESVKLKGGCIHHDNGPLGAAAIDRAEERRIELLKANGFNAIRSAHNPPSPALLDACDRFGLLVIDEAFDQWTQSKEHNEQDYHRFFKDWSDRDIASMVRRDRNHPSVIFWSIGNEIPEQFRAETTAKRLRELVLSHDPTRFITQGICNDWGKVIRNWDSLSDPAFLYLDVGGYNYLPGKYESDHARHPQRVILGTESYPKDALEYWSLVEKHPYVIGDFVWSAIDYLGEAGLAHSLLSDQKDSFFMSWPWFNSWSGDLDICGFKKPASYYRDVVWRRSQIEMFVHAPISFGLTETVSGWGWPDEYQSWNWTGQEGKSLPISVYSRCDTVQLRLNGKIIGEKSVSEATKLTARFEVPYFPGELVAYGLMNGKVVAHTALKTTGTPKKLKLTADRTSIRADRNDLSYVTVEIADESGRRVPNADIPVRFSVTGVGKLAAQGSGSPNDPASFCMPARRTFQGRCLAIIRPTGGSGNITLRAEAEGLEPESIIIKAR